METNNTILSLFDNDINDTYDNNEINEFYNDLNNYSNNDDLILEQSLNQIENNENLINLITIQNNLNKKKKRKRNFPISSPNKIPKIIENNDILNINNKDSDEIDEKLLNIVENINNETKRKKNYNNIINNEFINNNIEYLKNNLNYNNEINEYKLDNNNTIKIILEKNNKRGRNINYSNAKKIKTKINHSLKFFEIFIIICNLFNISIYYILFNILTNTKFGIALIFDIIQYLLKNDAKYINITKQDIYNKLMEILNKLIVNKDDIIYAKDCISLSKERYTIFSSIVDPKHFILKAMDELQIRISSWNKIVNNIYNFQYDKNYILISIKKLLITIGKYCKLLNEMPENNEFNFKITMDGRKHQTDEVGIGIIPLNIISLATQEVNSIFYILLYYGKENLQDLLKYITPIKNEIKDLLLNGFYINNVLYKVKFTWVSDLKSLWLVLSIPDDEFCPFCECKKINCYKFEKHPKRIFNHLLNIDNIKICILHLKCRVIEKLLKLITFNNIKLIDKLNEILNEEGFHINFTYENINENEDFTYLKLSMINGDNCDKITKIGERIINKLEIFSNQQENIEFNNINWQNIKLWWRIWIIINKVIHFKSTELYNFNLDEFQKLLNIWYMLLINQFGPQSITFYIHIIIHHIVDLLKEGTLTIYSQQSFENCHKYHKMIKSRGATNGGCWHKKTTFLQIFEQFYRRWSIKLAYLIFNNENKI